jgi:N12 class adenine-specific DNA methylase
MANPNDNIRRLYQNGLKHFSLPDFDTFQQDMKDEQKRKRFYNSMQSAYDLPDFDTFSQYIGAVAPPVPAQSTAQPQSAAPTSTTVQPVKDNTAQSAAVQPTVTSTAQPAQPEGWKPSPVQMQAFQDQMNSTMKSFQKTMDEGRQRMENVKKGTAFNASQGVREFNPQTGKMETAYYTVTGDRVASRLEQSRRNTEYNNWWYNNTEEGKRSKALHDKWDDDARQQVFDTSLATLWQRHDPAEGASAAEAAWSAAEARQKAAQNANASQVYRDRGDAMSNAAFLGGRENHIMNAAELSHKNQVAHYTNFDLDRLMNDAWDNLGEDGQKALIDDCHKMLMRRYPGIDELVAYDKAKELARHESDLRLYNLAKEKNLPKSNLEYLLRKVGDANLLMNVSKGLAVWSADGKTGDMAAYEAANEEYRQDGHKILSVVGTVAGFAVDPTTWLSAGVGNAATKGAMWAGGRFMAGRGASAAVTNAATRQFATSMTGRIVGGIAGGAANFGTFEGVKEMENQFAHGGKVATMDENGNLLREGRYVNEGYSASAVGGQFLHGLGMGAAIGWLGPVTGNVSDKLVRGGELFGKTVSGVSNTFGKVGVRAGMYTGATIAEGTIFSVPEWIEGKRDGFDVWTDNMAMMVGFKAKHMLKSAGGVLGDLKASFDSPTNGQKNRLDFESRLRQRMDAPSDGGMSLTKDEKAELERYGYNLKDLVESAEKTGDASKGVLIAENAPEIVSRLTDMVHDSRLSEAARAKLYYYATGRRLPMSTVMRGELIEDGDGGFIVESQGANGVITSRSFKSRKAADLELERIKRQTELNSIEIGERYQQTADFENRLQEACRTVAAENGWDMVEVYRTCEEARRNHLRGGDKQFNEAQQNILGKVVKAMGDFKETEVTDIMRGSINEKYGVDIDAAIRKDANRRTQAELSAVNEYLDALIPDKAKERPNDVTDVEAEDITNQKRLSDERPDDPFSDFTDPSEPIDPRFEQPGSPNDIDPHQPAPDPDAPKKAVGRATMKYQDRQVEVIDGRVVMTDDGTMIDNERSDRTIVIRDIQTGKEEVVSPEAILTYEDYPEDSMEAAPADVSSEPASPADLAADAPKYTSGIIKVRNADGSESRGVLTGYIDEDGRHEYYLEGQTDKLLYASDEELDAVLTDYTPDAPKTEEQPAAGGANVVEYDNGRDAGLRDAAAMSDEKLAQEIDNLRNLGNLTDFGRGMLDGYEHVQQERQGMANPAPQPAEDAIPGTVPNSAENVPANSENVPNVPESGNTAGKNIPQNGNIAPENIPQTENPAPNAQPEQPQSALSRIPLDEKGKPNFAGAPDTDTAWDALVEKTNDEAMAQSYADNMVAAKEAALKKAEKAKTKPTEDLDEFMAAEQQRKNAITAAQNELATWQRIAGTSKRRSDAIRAQQEAEARAAAQARAEQEAVDKAAREEQERIEREALEGIPEWHLDTPENARKRGARRFQGQLFTRQEPLQGVAGKEIEVKFSQNDLPKGRVAVIDAAQLQPSHIQGNRNPMFFIEDAQPKNRAEQVSMMAAREIAEGIRPEEITGSATAYTGAPTVNTRGEVIQGNNRSDALRYLWENNLPEQQGKYRQYIIDNAAQFGLDPEAVANMEHPVLVNMLDVDDAEAVRLGMMTAQDTESGGVERIKPKNVAQKLGDGMRTFANMLLNSGDEDASFGQLVDRNGTEVLKWMAQTGAITGTQHRSAFDSKGNLTAEAKNDLQKVLYQAVFKGGSQQLEEMFDKLPAKAQRAILSTAFRDMDSPFTGRLLPELQASIVAYNELMTDPVFASAKKLEECLNAVEAYKRVLSLDDRFETVSPSDNFSNFAMHLAAMYKASDLSQSALASYFNQMYDLAQGKKAATLFEEADTTEYPLAEVVNKVLGIDYQPAKNGNNNVANGGADVALHNQNGQGGELRGNEPPASGEQNPAGTEPSDGGTGTSDDSRAAAEAVKTEDEPEKPTAPETPANQTVGKGYKIEPKPYTNKQGKTLDTYLVTFDRDLSKEEMSTLRAKAKAVKGWYDRETGGWMLRSQEDARVFADEFAGKSEDEIADEAPLSIADITPAEQPKPADKGSNKPEAKASGTKKSRKSPINQVSIEDVFADLYSEGETKLSDHAKPTETEPPKPKKRRWISDEDAAEFDDLRNNLRSHLGSDDTIAQEEAASYGKPQPKQMDAEVLRMGTRMTYLMMKGGLRKFSDYAEAMIDEVGDAIRPHLKSLYAAAQNMEEVMQLGWDEEMDDRKTVKAFDVYNFDKPGAKDIIATAQHVASEQTSQQQTDQVVQSLKDQRNEQRKKEADEASADTEAIADKAEATASQVESQLPSARTEQDAERLIADLDKELEAVNEQLALLGYYEADTSDPSKFHESYGYMLTAEKKAVDDAARLTQQLAKDLGLDIGKIKSLTTRGKVNKKTFYAVRSNLAPACGDISICLPLNENAELHINISVEPAAERGGKSRIPFYGYADNLEVSGGYFRVENPNATGSDHYVTANRHFTAEVTYDDLLADIRRDTRHLLPEDEVRNDVPAEPQPTETPVEPRKKDEAYHGVVTLKDGREAVVLVANHQQENGGEPRLTDYIVGVKGEPGTVKISPYDIAHAGAPTAEDKGGEVEKPKADKKPSVEPEQTMGNLFGNLFDTEDNSVSSQKDNTTSKPKTNEKTDLQPRAEEAGRGRQQPRPNEPLGESAEHEDERPDGRGVAKRSGVHTVSDSQRSGSVSQPHKGERSLTEPKNTHNNHAERGVDYAPKGEKARIDANIAAIELARKLLNAGATATPKEMEVLRRYSGWGGLGAAFKEARNQWERNPINERLRQLLTPEEYDAAVMSRNSAYYTPAPVIDAMWDIAKALGFKGGSILEGSAGIGNIIGLMPTDISGRSSIHAVEIDNTTGGILSLLYPDAKVEVQGFEKTKVRNGSVDLAITNVPFVTGLHVMDESGDSDLSKKFRDIHDFCIAKNVRKLREGGIGIFITSSGTLDKSQKLRDWLIGSKEGNADVVGVFRMHNQTFGGTAATSDIIVVRKRVNGRRSAHAIDVSTVMPAKVVTYTDDYGKSKDLPLLINRYFIEHPEHMGGEMFFGFEQGDTYRPTSIGLFPTRTADQAARMAAWVQHLADMDWSKEQGKAVAEQTSHINEALGEGVKEGSMVTDSDGNLCVARMGRAVPLALNKNKIKGRTKEECFKDYTEIKSALADVLKYQTEHDDDAGLQPLLDRLNRAYDTFVQRYGNLNKNNNLAWLRNDVDFSSIVALETYSEKGNKDGTKIKTYGKTDIFSRRVVEKESEPTPKNVKDGIIASIYKYGRIDTEYLATQLGKSQDDVKQEIVESGLGFVDPTTGQMEVSYEYLSGNVREKLRQAREANEAAGGAYDANIKALEAVVPMNIPAHLIEFALGSSWIEPQLYERYVKERTELYVKLTNAGGTWHMAEPWNTDKPKNTEMGVRSEAFGILIPGHKLIEAALTNKTITVSRTVKDSDGGSHTETDPAATTACATKVDEIRQDFKDWAREQMQNDPALSMRMEEKYNEKFNNSVTKTIPDDFVPSHFGGAATVVNGDPFQLRPHQAKAVIRATTQPVLLAHEVGTGKTYTLITTAMEMRRLGTARKPMIVVQNATVGQFVASAKALYPNAKILTLEDADRNEEGRMAFYAKIKYNDWDMIVVPQSVFERIPDSVERQTKFIEDKIAEKELVLEQMEAADPNNGRNPIVNAAKREIEKARAEIAQLHETGSIAPTTKKKEKDAKKAAVRRHNSEVKAREMLDRKTDAIEDFDSMGIDAVLVDEAHEYKHLGFATAMQRGVKGVDPSFSKKSQGVFLKVQSVLEKTGGKNVVFATGTPISNTAAEIWTFMRYLIPADVMKEYDIFYFDDFVRNFGNIQQMLEFKTNGKYDEVNRFAGYFNLPELVRIWSTVADTVLTREAGGVSDKIPQMEGGKAQDIFLPQTRALRSIMKFVKDELKRYEDMTGKEKKENSHIPLVMYGIAKAAAVDARLVQSDAEDDPKSKTNEAVRQTLRSLEETKDYKGTVAIFADNYQNKASGFNLYEDIRKKLIAAGVPEEQVVVMKSGMTVKKKLEIFDKVNSGEVRVIMGSTFTLGTGVNIQERLHTLIHLDAPNRPMDYTQRNGRILRQGNLHNTWGLPVRILRFGVEDSLDVTAYQRLKTKGAIADSIMNGKQLMANSMENRTLEEDQDLFGDITAQLSGSEYAMLKNQIEKEVRKLRAAEKNWKADQTYIHNRKRQIAGQNREAEKRIADNKGYLEKVEAATIGDITVGRLSFPSVESMEDFFTEQNKKKAAMQEEVRTSGYSSRPATSDITISVGGFDFKIHTEITKEMKHQQGDLFATAPAKMTYSCPELGIDAMPVRGNAIKNAVLDIMENVVSGKDFRERIAHAENYLERNNAEFEAISKRDGQPFKDAEALEKAEEKLAEYEELMKKEMEEKEAKYADMDKEVEAAANIEYTEEDSETEEAGEPTPAYNPEKSSKFANSYETQDGKTVRYNSANPEAYAVSEPEDGAADSGAGRAGVQRKKDTPITTSNIGGLNAAEGEFSLVERQFTENKSFSFTSGARIKSADDVAFIFSALEDAAKEHSFVVYVKNGKPTVIELGMGTFSATMVDVPTASLAYSRIKPDQVYFVHNHPSGQLKCSTQDIQVLRAVESMCDVPVLGVIINLKTGRYGTFDTSNNTDVGVKRTPAKEHQLKVYTLDKQIFAPDYDPMSQPLVKGSYDVASFLNSQRMGDRAKVSFLILTRANRIVGNIHTPFTEISSNPREVARYISERVIQLGGESAILYGDFEMTAGASTAWQRVKTEMDNVGKTRLLDVVSVMGNHTRSAIDDGLLREPGSDYGAPDLRFREVEDEGVLSEFAEGKTVKVYRTMQLIDGKLYSPMATKVNGVETPEIKLGVPEQSEEHPEIVKKTRIGDDGVEVGYITLNKGLGKGTLSDISYNPYIHTSRGVINDQFSSAYIRPNLVTVEVEIPESELSNPYRAQYAKNSVGEMSWHSGTVSGQLAAVGRPRRVILSRYDKPVRILTNREVAQKIAEQLAGTDVAIPYNVVTPQVCAELERLGVEISEEATGTVGDKTDFGKAEYITDREIERINAREAEKRQTSPEAKQEYAERLSKKFNTPIRIVTDVNELTHENPEIQAAMRRHKGFYDVRTGEVVVVVPNNADVEDVAESVFHEVVAHKGLREMIGKDNYDAFCDEIYDHLEDELKQKIDEETTRRFMNDPAKEHDYHRRVAVDEMFGRMSEKGFEDFTKAERGLWKKLKKKVLEAINKFLGSLKLPKWVKLGDNELRYILWRSHERLRSKGDYVDMARDAVKREELGLNDKTKPEPTESEKRARAMSRSKREFESTRDRAIREKGIVTPGLNDGEVRIVRVGQHPFSGDKPIKQAEAWAKAHLVGLHTATDSRGEEFEYSISKNKVEKQLSVSAVGRSENLGVHLAALTKLPEIISESIEAEIHPDYKKGADGQRKPENGVNNAALIHRFYGAAEIDGKIYRVKTTMEEFVDDNRPNTPHSFEVTKIELLEAPSASTDNGSGQPLAMTSNNSNGVQENASSIRNGALGTTKLLENVEKSYDAGKKLLDESGLAEEPTYEYRFRDGETGDIWNDQSIGFEERITNAAIRLSNNQSGDLTLRNDAMRAIGGNLTSLRRAMAAQKRYDQATVKRVADLARILMQNGYLSDMTSGEMQRLISAVKNAVGHTAVKESVQKIMDIMVNNQLRNGEATLRKLLTIRGSKVDARGVEVQGALDVDGQRTLEVVKKAMGLTEDDIANRIAEALNRMSDPDQTIADQAALEYAGLNMALDYVQNIAASKADEKALRDSIKIAKEDKDAGRMTDDAYKQFVEATEDAIRKNKIDRTEAYFNLVGRLSDSLRESIENAKAFREAEKARVNEIHHNANSDMEGRPTNEHHKDNWKDKFVNNGFVQFLFAPLGTFDQILRVFGNKSANGEGYLWNRFMRGWVDCRNKELLGVKEKFARLDEKAAELFGKGKTWGNLIRMEAKMPKATVSFWDGGEMRDHELTQGNLLYIYMVDKMTDGRMKLRRMGITEDDITRMENFLDPRFKAIGDWLQDEFLVDTRNEYNETHKRMFGASMAAIENYFPLKILANARVDKEEDVNQQNRPDGITTKTGSIIKRRVNNLALDITGADALSVILDHITQMEHWSAYAEWNRDLNTLRTYKRFRNQVINMTTVYGGGRNLWENFNDLCLMAAGEYRPPVSKLNKSAVNLAKGVTAAKVSFRMYTALKQLLSAPAYIPEVSTSAIAKSIANPYGDFKWCLENMPIFRERWHSRISGDPRLLKSDMDWKMWRSRIMEISSRIGMTPNAFVDAVTVSIGARAMYETRLKQYLKEAYPTDAAEKRALQDATILFNQTQQSTESPFLSTMQVDKDWLSTLFTVFRNSAMSYTRQEFDAMRNLKRNLTPGQQAKSIEFMTKQILRDWDVDPDTATDSERDQAQGAAKKRFRRQLKKDALRVATFGYILEWLWNLGPYLPYIIFGALLLEKYKMWDDAFTHAYFGSVEGLTGGDVMSSFGNMWASGEWNWNKLSKDMPLASDINTIANKFIGGKNAEAVNDIINLIVQSGIGMNPQSITDAAVAITDACGDDPALSHEAAIFVMRVLQVPQSQIDKMYFDEVGLSGEETSKLTPEQLARRYAEYKVKRGTPFAPWSWGDEERLDKYKDAAGTKIKERMEGQSDKAVAEAYADYEARYKAISQRMTDARALAKTDYVAAAQAFAELQKDPDLVVYRQFGALDKQLSKMSTMLLQSKTPEEAALLNETIKEYRAGMVKALQAETPEAQQSSISELTTLMNGFSAKYTTLRQQAQGVKR